MKYFLWLNGRLTTKIPIYLVRRLNSKGSYEIWTRIWKKQNRKKHILKNIKIIIFSKQIFVLILLERENKIVRNRWSQLNLFKNRGLKFASKGTKAIPCLYALYQKKCLLMQSIPMMLSWRCSSTTISCMIFLPINCIGNRYVPW